MQGDIKLENFTDLLLAPQLGHDSIMRILLEVDGRAGINLLDIQCGISPLSWAASAEHDSVCEMLLDDGADFNVQGPYNRQNPVSWTVTNEHASTVKLLLKRDAAVDMKDANAHTTLMTACQAGNETIVRLLLENCAFVKDMYKHKRTPLLWLIQRHDGGTSSNHCTYVMCKAGTGL